MHTADLGSACFSLERPSPPQLWAAPFPGTAQGDTLALQPERLHALLLNRAPLPHVLGTGGALLVMMEIPAPQGVPVLPNHPHPAGAEKGRNSWKEFWQPWDFLSAIPARRRYLVSLCLRALPFFIL